MDENSLSHSTLSGDLSFDEDYSKMLDIYNLQYSIDELWLVVGNIPNDQGFILFLPIKIDDFRKVLCKIIKWLIQVDVAFKIPLNRDTHYLLREGYYGDENLGKIVCLYPSQDLLTDEFLSELIYLTDGYIGTFMPYALKISDLVYTRYGSFHIMSSPMGELIYNVKGELIKDEYFIPYTLPHWVKWPFKKEFIQQNHTSETILNKKYFINRTIRNAPKGRVMHVLRRKGWFNFQHFLIKEGRKGMYTDDQNRDICDRLHWQKEILQALSETVSVPTFYDFFPYNGNEYLVTEYIDGFRVEDYANELFKQNSWTVLSQGIKVKIIGILKQMIDILETLHNNGYVHRDVTLSNFMINKGNKVFLTDLELAYSLEKKIPDPPFQIGTEGYMSPEQEEAIVLPTIAQDIYSLGAVFLTILTRLSPKKFLKIPNTAIKDSLLFFLGNEVLSNIILSCLDSNPVNRPSLKTLRSKINDSIVIPTINYSSNLSNELISNMIDKGIKSLMLPSLTDLSGQWVAPTDANTDLRYVFIDFKKGISGIMYSISYAKFMGFNTSALSQLVSNNLGFLENNFLFAEKEVPPGYYNGSAGVALCLAKAMDSGLIECSEKHTKYLKNCLYNIPANLDFADGMAGYGTVLINCSNFLSCEYVDERLSIIIHTLLNAQQKDGHWHFQGENNKPSALIGFEYGTAGIVWFLLLCYKRNVDINIKNSIYKALKWLSKMSVKYESGIIWPHHSKTKESTFFFSGSSGVLLTFIKAYEEFREPIYKKIIEEGISAIPFNIISNDLSFSNGLVGLGEVYLEAFRVLKNVDYYKRAEWLVNIFSHLKVPQEESIIWIHNRVKYPSPALFEGISGILYFLIHFINPEKDCFLLKGLKND